MIGYPCPYCNLVFSHSRGLAWHCHLVHLLSITDSPSLSGIVDGSAKTLQRAGCPFCKEHVGPAVDCDDDFYSPSWVKTISYPPLEEIWHNHFSQCNGYAAAMLSGVKL